MEQTTFQNWVVETGRADRTVIVRINRPEARNAMSRHAMEELSAITDALQASEGIGCVVLTGTGEGAFIAGGDLKDFSQLETSEEGAQMGRRMQDILTRWESLPMPTIAAIGANAYGGGCEVALACDMRVMADTASLVFSQVRLGLMTGWGGAFRLVRLVGPAQAMAILTTGEYVDATRGQALGLLNGVAPEGFALAHALDLARQITRHDDGAVRSVKKAVSASMHLSREEAMEVENRLFEGRWNSAPHQQAVARFLQRSVTPVNTRESREKGNES